MGTVTAGPVADEGTQGRLLHLNAESGAKFVESSAKMADGIVNIILL